MDKKDPFKWGCNWLFYYLEEQLRVIEQLIEKKDLRKYHLIKLLEMDPFLSKSKSFIKDEFKLSEYLLRVTIDRLQEDCCEFGITEEFKITEDDSIISIEELGGVTSNFFLKKYLQKSIGVKMLLQILMGKFDSAPEFASTHFTSNSIVYKWLDKVQESLKPLDLELVKKKGSYSIAGNERTVRLLGVNLLHRTELAGSLFSEQMLIRATHIVDIIERNYKPMRPSHKNRIINYVLIALSSDKSTRKLSRRIKEKLMKSETFKELKQLLLANGIKKLCQENELNEFIGILILNEALSEQAAEELVNEEIQSDLIELFIEKLFQSFPQIYTSSLKKEITNRMARIHFNAIFSGKVLLFENIFDLSYFQENYQVVFDFCRSFIATQKKAKNLFVQEHAVYLYYHYLLMLVNCLSPEMLQSAINITIDFSFGEEYNLFIKRSIKNICSHLNLDFQPTLMKNTDVLLTDSNNLDNSKLNSTLVIYWLEPPRAIDWFNFVNILIKKRRSFD